MFKKYQKVLDVRRSYAMIVCGCISMIIGAAGIILFIRNHALYPDVTRWGEGFVPYMSYFIFCFLCGIVCFLFSGKKEKPVDDNTIYVSETGSIVAFGCIVEAISLILQMIPLITVAEGDETIGVLVAVMFVFKLFSLLCYIYSRTFCIFASGEVITIQELFHKDRIVNVSDIDVYNSFPDIYRNSDGRKLFRVYEAYKNTDELFEFITKDMSREERGLVKDISAENKLNESIYAQEMRRFDRLGYTREKCAAVKKSYYIIEGICLLLMIVTFLGTYFFAIKSVLIFAAATLGMGVIFIHFLITIDFSRYSLRRYERLGGDKITKALDETHYEQNFLFFGAMIYLIMWVRNVPLEVLYISDLYLSVVAFGITAVIWIAFKRSFFKRKKGHPYWSKVFESVVICLLFGPVASGVAYLICYGIISYVVR